MEISVSVHEETTFKDRNCNGNLETQKDKLSILDLPSLKEDICWYICSVFKQLILLYIDMPVMKSSRQLSFVPL